jgi:hypothetical protein
MCGRQPTTASATVTQAHFGTGQRGGDFVVTADQRLMTLSGHELEE